MKCFVAKEEIIYIVFFSYFFGNHLTYEVTPDRVTTVNSTKGVWYHIDLSLHDFYYSAEGNIKKFVQTS